MRQRALPKPTPKGCPDCGARETRGSLLHRPMCSKARATHRVVTEGTPTEVLRGGIVPPDFSAIWLYCMIDHGKGSLPSGPCPECVEAYAVSGPPDGKWNSTTVTAGRKGGQTRASHLSSEQRSESARKAAKARWGKADA